MFRRPRLNSANVTPVSNPGQTLREQGRFWWRAPLAVPAITPTSDGRSMPSHPHPATAMPGGTLGMLWADSTGYGSWSNCFSERYWRHDLAWRSPAVSYSPTSSGWSFPPCSNSVVFRVISQVAPELRVCATLRAPSKTLESCVLDPPA